MATEALAIKAEFKALEDYLDAMEAEDANHSGIFPTEFKCLVLPNKVEDVTKGGIILPDEVKHRAKFAEMEGVLIAASPAAFTYINAAEWDGQKPAVGDRVIIAKYAGVHVKGDDGVEYVLINDKDIAAVRK
jgi:co-chaperonin GroES (HSP10)